MIAPISAHVIQSERAVVTQLMLKDAQWKVGGLQVTLLETFELLRRSNGPKANALNGNGGPKKDFEVAPRHGFEPRT